MNTHFRVSARRRSCLRSQVCQCQCADPTRASSARSKSLGGSRPQCSRRRQRHGSACCEWSVCHKTPSAAKFPFITFERRRRQHQSCHGRTSGTNPGRAGGGGWRWVFMVHEGNMNCPSTCWPESPRRPPSPPPARPQSQTGCGVARADQCCAAVHDTWPPPTTTQPPSVRRAGVSGSSAPVVRVAGGGCGSPPLV